MTNNALNDRFELSVITPFGSLAHIDCDLITINIIDGKKGNEGGSYGIKPGHACASFALASGEKISAYLEDEIVFEAIASSGFVMTDHNRVTVTVDSIQIIK